MRRLLLLVALVPAACTNGNGAQDMAVGLEDLAVAGPDFAGRDLALTPLCTDHDLDRDGGIVATLTVVQRVFDRYCIQCHNNNPNIVDLTSGHARASLVGKTAPDTDNMCGGTLVDPGDPAGSFLLTKLTNDVTCNATGQRMPPGGRLQDCEIELIRRWIEAGASE